MPANPARYRPELPAIPRRMLDLPVRRGYPVPWFVDVNPETGDYDFRMMDGRKAKRAVMQRRCWLCGDPLGRHFAFNIGPMCAINRVGSEPPSHLECADFAARACPFLSRPNEKRREDRLPEEMGVAPGVHLERNPGVALVWVTSSYRLFHTEATGVKVPGATESTGVLFRIGPAEELRWYACGREATRQEISESIASGLPALRQVAVQQGTEEALEKEIVAAMQLLPA